MGALNLWLNDFIISVIVVAAIGLMIMAFMVDDNPTDDEIKRDVERNEEQQKSA
ncbi:hypothetical protein [Convivina praedatoris]|uniref:Uncharacterized protein n=1 Tax=Convivina praedatoris TaxID=2880963 RepID=A0ABM9D2K1_9LACO|nr:hypothetical protein [Convivina sp. LMG 32447]CAH1857549.1 hypothetical protein R077811_01574 [Convivina intestini]CAH1854533.1 hypothetical protein R077815_01075 [Convivina sp. LMG 32447]CAH1855809.1 hypothetical protein R078138_01215 [Convivina sp. LMG 32447]CAH1855892.1 hypothetical protein LMG032447_01189 [Convivina sp. LMG 32447]CAH1855988.1 hypothetical protein R078138_01235 [Convivina sp. LMG 32447]